MKNIKIGFIDTFKALENFVIGCLEKRFIVKIDNKSPDFLFFCDENFGSANLRFDHNCIRIFMTGENRRPQNYKCHYAATFDHIFEEWHFRFPLAILEMFSMQFDRPDLYTVNYINDVDKQKDPFNREFCGFMHRNGMNTLRNFVFHEISKKYKKIDSAGPLFNNTGLNLPTLQEKIDWLRTKKFTLCFENATHPGYITEKILHAFYANTIPIYWGDPTADLIFNSESFIDATKMKNTEELISFIKFFDSNEAAYINMLNKSPIKYKMPVFDIYEFNFLNWFESVVMQKRNARQL